MSDLRALLSVLKRQWKLIVLMALLMTGLAGAITFSMKTVYTASTLVLVDPSQKNLLDPQSNPAAGLSDNARVESEVELATADSVLMRVIEDLKLTENSEFSPKLGLREQLMVFLHLGEPALPTGEDALNKVLDALRMSVSVQRRGFTYLLAIEARSDKPARAAEIANSLANSYIREQLDAKVGSVMVAKDALNGQLVDAQQKIVDADNSFDDYMANNIKRIEAESGNSAIASLQQQIEQLDAARSTAQSTVDVVREQLSRRDWASSATQLASSALQDLERQRAELSAQITQTSGDGPGVADLRGRLAQIETQLNDTTNGAITELQQEITTNQEQGEALRQQVRNAVVNSDLSSAILTEFYGLQQRAQLARNQYQTLLARTQDLDVQVSLQLADSRVISPALPPSNPSAPNIRINLILGSLAGLVIGLALAFLYENYIGGFTNEQQAERLLRLPVVAAIPRLRRNSPSYTAPADLMQSAPLSSYAEAFRRISVGVTQALDLSVDEPRPLVLMVTSAVPGEGKSTTALSLARAYAFGGKTTLLIDADLRKPSLHRLVGLQPEEGLLDLLVSKSNNFTGIAHQDPKSGASLLLGARRAAVPTHQVVSDKAFSALLQAARKTFEVVIVDTSPLLPVVDGLQIAALVDAVVFVVQIGKTAQQDAKKALTSLQIVRKDKPVLLVLNQQELTHSEYTKRYSDYYVEEAS